MGTETATKEDMMNERREYERCETVEFEGREVDVDYVAHWCSGTVTSIELQSISQDGEICYEGDLDWPELKQAIVDHEERGSSY